MDSPDRTTPSSRRDFVSGLGTAAVAGALLPALTPAAALALAPERLAAAASVPRGLAPAGDFLLDPDLTYLQTGSLGPTPRPVIDRAVALWHELERNPTLWGYGAHEQALEEVRNKAAAFIGCATEELVITGCTTDGMNRVAQGLHLAAGDHVLTTDQEHPGGRSGWEYLARTAGVVLQDVPIAPDAHDPRAIVDAFAARITPRTRVLMFSHLLTSSGLRMPVAELSALGRSRGCIVVVDGAQAVGGIEVDVKALGCHAYVTAGHKWLLGPKGTGLLYLSRELGTAIDPIQAQAGRQVYSASNGVCSLPSVLGLGASIDYLVAIGKARVEAHNMALRQRVHDGLRALPRLRVVSSDRGAQASPLVTYALPPAITGGAMQQALLTKHRVMVKTVPANFLNGNRISTHLFNSEQDVDRLLAALRAELS